MLSRRILTQFISGARLDPEQCTIKQAVAALFNQAGRLLCRYANIAAMSMSPGEQPQAHLPKRSQFHSHPDSIAAP